MTAANPIRATTSPSSRYDLLVKIGIGGTATVYVARPFEPSRGPAFVAVKRMHRHLLELPDVRRLLEQRRGAPALLIEGIAFDADGVPVEFGRTFVRGDRSRYFVEREVDRPVRSIAAETTVGIGGASG